MEIRFQNSKAISLSFPQRKLRNIAEKNWNNSKRQRIFLEEKDIRIDGSTGDVIIDFKVLPYLKKKIVSGEVKINGVYIPNQTDPKIEKLLEIQEKVRLNGKTFRKANPIELIQAGFLKLKGVMKSVAA